LAQTHLNFIANDQNTRQPYDFVVIVPIMRILSILLLILFLMPVAQAKTTITVGSTGETTDVNALNEDDVDDLAEQSQELIDPMSLQFVEDENGFLVDPASLASSFEDDEEAEEEPQAKQIYKGNKGRNKLEPARTHLMYEPTKY